MNPNTKKIVIIAAVVLLLGGAGYYWYTKKKGDSKDKDPFAKLTDGSSDNKESGKAPTKEELLKGVENDSSVFPLKKGSEGKRVAQLQRYLINEKGANLSKYGVDGIWGTETEAVVTEKLGRNNVSKDFFIKTEMYLQPTS